MTECHTCGCNTSPGDRFCGECGSRISSPDMVVSPIDGIGALSDHVDIVIDHKFAAITDVGIKHKRNDDAVAVKKVENNYYVSLSDGVTNSQTPDLASAIAVKTSIEYMLSDTTSTASQVIKESMVRAHRSVCNIPFDRAIDIDPPSATIINAIVKDDIATIGWLGDTRCYWVSDINSKLLTKDHSWMNHAIEIKKMDVQEAKNNKLAHAILKCLGMEDIDNFSECEEPSIIEFKINERGWLIICSDGLWNYTEEVENLKMVSKYGKYDNAYDVCQSLVTYAKINGGKDNISVAVLMF